MKLSAYPRYKASGVEWLGDVPEHWEVKRFGYLFRFYSGGTPSTADNDLWEGDLPWVSSKDMKSMLVFDTQDHISEEAVRKSATCKVPSGTLLMVNRSGILKHSIPAAVTTREMAINQDIRGCVPASEVDSKFMVYFIAGNQTSLLALWRQQGATVESLEFESVKSTRLHMPSIAEQKAIAAFLDRETRRVDQLVAKKRELIERLKEKRTALISRTVTRGLYTADARTTGVPGEPAFKFSGFEWLGDVCVHWDVVTYKRVCTRVDVGIAEAATHAYCDDGVPIIRSTNVKPNNLETHDLLRVEPWFAEKNRSKTLRAGDLVTVRTGYPGTTAVVPAELDGSQCFTLVLSSPRKDMHGPFFSWFMNSNPGASYFEMEGWGTAQTNISVPIVQFMPVPRPPLTEQRAIAAFLSKETAKLGALVAKVEEAIERLQEYRTALITAAVTGKIDVRGAAR